MFSIFDGRKSFYQWDSDRKVIVNDDSIKQVHFCNRTDDCSLVVDTYKDGNLTVANVPNILLQSDLRIIVYAFDSQYTKFSDCFNVIKRTKPADYVYTETEVKTYTLLEERMKELEAAVSVDSIAQAVEDYLKENPVEAGATAAEAAQIAKNTEDIGTLKAEGANYATKEYVDNSVSNVDIPEVPSNISAFTNDAGYQTAAEVESIVDEAIKDIEIPGGGGSGGESEWRLIRTVKIPAEEPVAGGVTITTDENGNPFELLEVAIRVKERARVGGYAYGAIRANDKYVGEERRDTPMLILIRDIGGLWTAGTMGMGYQDNGALGNWGYNRDAYNVCLVNDNPTINKIRLDFCSCDMEIYGKVRK